ncbi:NrsF family protein [Novosphingobium huizhouense]|uniref:NrsF family protein n=1 Tax=Novosphingobium huizhouense TaxID=2866625 RepID=UPI001CD84687|nr:NrsF family protein [Novosphingobium huizhouense]
MNGAPPLHDGLEETAIATEDLIGALAKDLAPVRPVRWQAAALASLATGIVCALALGIVPGWRPDVARGAPAAIVEQRLALLVLAGALLAMAAAREAMPGAKKALLRRAGLALAALPMMIAVLSWPVAAATVQQAARLELAGIGRCLLIATACALPPLVVLVHWARRSGAVTRPERAATTIGLAAGAIGTAAYSLTCPSQHWLFAGIAYPLAIALSAASARIVLPRWLRW